MFAKLWLCHTGHSHGLAQLGLGRCRETTPRVMLTVYLARKYGHQPFCLPISFRSSRLYAPGSTGESRPLASNSCMRERERDRFSDGRKSCFVCNYANTLLKSDVTRRDHVVRCHRSQECGSRFVNFIVNFIRDGTVFA